MVDNTLPGIFTPKEIAEHLKIGEGVILHEIESGALRGFRVGQEWRCSEGELLSYIRGQMGRVEARQTQPIRTTEYSSTWDMSEIGPFVFDWPKKGGGVKPERYEGGYEVTADVNSKEYTFKIGFGNRKSAGRVRPRFTIWLGNRAIVEFAGGNNYESDGLLAGIIRLKNGKQLTSQRIPDEYRNFRIERYNSVVRGPRASTGMAVIVHKDDIKSMLEHAMIRCSWKEII